MKKIVIAFLLCFAVSSVGFAKVYKLSHMQPKTHPDHLAYEFFAAKVKEYTKGSVDIKIYADAVLGDTKSSTQLAQKGVVDFTHASAAYLEGFSKEYSVFGLPYIFDNRDHFLRAMNGDLGAHFQDVPKQFGLVGILYLYAGSRSFYGNKPFKTPADLKGMKFRVMQSPIAMDTIKALGAIPTPMAYGEVFSALQQGVIDGAENNEPSYVTAGHYEVSKFYSYDEHQMVPDFLLMNINAWNKLKPEDQAAIRKAANETEVKFLEYWDASVKQSIDAAKEKGCTFVDVDKAAYQAAVAPVIEKAKADSLLKQDIDTIAKYKGSN